MDDRLADQRESSTTDDAFVRAAGVSLAASRCIRNGFRLPPPVTWFLFGPDGHPDEAAENVGVLYLWVMAQRSENVVDDSLELRTWSSSVTKVSSDSRALGMSR